MYVGRKTEQAEYVKVARRAGLAALIVRPAPMQKTVIVQHVLTDSREGCFSPEVNIGRAIHVPAALEAEGRFGLAQRGRLSLRVPKFELSPVLSSDTSGTLLRLVATATASTSASRLRSRSRVFLRFRGYSLIPVCAIATPRRQARTSLDF